MHPEQIADDHAYGNYNENYCQVHGGLVFKGRNPRLKVIYLIIHYAHFFILQFLGFPNCWL